MILRVPILLLLLLATCARNATAVFPYGRCYTNGCQAAPIALLGPQIVPGGFCFDLTAKPCVDGTASNCCSLFSKFLNKIVIKTDSLCYDKIKSVAIDGVKKGGGVYSDIYNNNETELRLTNLLSNTSSMNGKRLCIFPSAPSCVDPLAFCGQLPCLYSVFDTTFHECCPTCSSSWSPSPPPQVFQSPPPPPPPRVFQSPSPPPPPRVFQSPPPPNNAVTVFVNNHVYNCTLF